MAELEKVTVWTAEGRQINVNRTDVDRWIGEGCTLEAPKPRAPRDVEQSSEPTLDWSGGKKKRGRASE